MPDNPQAPGELTSWKEIAAFLGVNVRTAQRWETQRGLPVRRLPGEKGRVAASPPELSQWRRTILKEVPWWSDPRFLQKYAIGATALVIILAGVIAVNYFSASRKGPPAMARPEYKTLVVTDRRGNELWRKSFPEVLSPVAYSGEQGSRATWFGDLDGDSRLELLFVYYPVSLEKIRTTLYCFSDKGEERWRFEPGNVVTDGGETYSADYITGDLAVLGSGERGGHRIVLTSHQLTYYPDQVALLDARGKTLGEYWHPGHLDRLAVADLDDDGVVEILLAGVNNAYRAATLVILDSRSVAGAFSQLEGSRYQLRGFPRAAEKALLLFPRSCINQALEWYNIAKMVTVDAGTVRVGVQEKIDDPHCAVFYTLDRKLNVTQVEFSDRLRALHRQLETSGQLDHPLRPSEIDGMRTLRDLLGTPITRGPGEPSRRPSLP